MKSLWNQGLSQHTDGYGTDAPAAELSGRYGRWLCIQNVNNDQGLNRNFLIPYRE
jgi:hypothetical protein